MINRMEVFRALGDPIRIRIYDRLDLCGEQCVTELVEALGITQPTVSYHLSVMRSARLVSSRRDGRHIYYKLTHTISIGHRDESQEDHVVSDTDG